MIPELQKLAELINRESRLSDLIQVETPAHVEFRGEKHPLYSFLVGNVDNQASPLLIITGGVHGIERIGAQLAWSLLKTTVDRLLWDNSLRKNLDHYRILFLPMINPVGFKHLMRSNGQGVDLMRNSPVKILDSSIPFLSGQSYTNKLPWFQGQPGQLEIESQFLIEQVLKFGQKSPAIISIDLHSGFGFKDRLWFPFSHTTSEFPEIAELTSLISLFEETHPYHIYKVEPQSHGYLISGDLWDHAYFELKKINPNVIFLPFTLEMGSWTWVRKNPLQIFSKTGMYNPIKDHRIKRTYRRHYLLFDFLQKALFSYENWANLNDEQKNRYLNSGRKRWNIR